MIIGVIFCGFNAQPYLADALCSWIEARKTQLAGHTFKIAAVSVPFESFPAGREDDTLDVLRGTLARNEIDHLIEGETPMKETEARGAALRWLAEQGCDVSWMVDSDELFETVQIEQLAAFVVRNPLITWFRVSYRNAVFTPDQYLVEPFQPPRIHRLRFDGCTAIGLWDDNNVLYRYDGGQLMRDINLSHLVVPKNRAWVRHMTWISNERSRDKVRYQSARAGWQCAFKWDTDKGLIWNPDLPIPETARD